MSLPFPVRQGHSVVNAMKTIRRLFTIRTKFEAFLAIYAIALGASERGVVYMYDYPGLAGQILFGACTLAVFVVDRQLTEVVGTDKDLGVVPPFRHHADLRIAEKFLQIAVDFSDFLDVQRVTPS